MSAFDKFQSSALEIFWNGIPACCQIITSLYTGQHAGSNLRRLLTFCTNAASITMWKCAICNSIQCFNVLRNVKFLIGNSMYNHCNWLNMWFYFLARVWVWREIFWYNFEDLTSRNRMTYLIQLERQMFVRLSLIWDWGDSRSCRWQNQEECRTGFCYTPEYFYFHRLYNTYFCFWLKGLVIHNTF